jgi:hypothetical protein
MKTGLGIIAAFAVALFATQAQAQAQSNSQADFDAKAQQVCGNDVFALCGEAVPDRGRIEACMRRKFSQVSAPCRQFMANYGRGQAGEARVSREHRRHITRHHAPRRHTTSRHRTSRHATRHHTTRHHRKYSDRR